jgi:hypothetical protein
LAVARIEAPSHSLAGPLLQPEADIVRQVESLSAIAVMRPPPAKPIPELDTRDEQNDRAQNFAEVYSGRMQKFAPRAGVSPAFLIAKPVYQAWK